MKKQKAEIEKIYLKILADAAKDYRYIGGGNDPTLDQYFLGKFRGGLFASDHLGKYLGRNPITDLFELFGITV